MPDIGWAALFTGGFVATTLTLQMLDLRTRYFSQGGWAYPVHHGLLAVLGLYLGWLFFAIGSWVLRLLYHRGEGTAPGGLDGVILCCFTGLACVQLAVIGAGFLGLFVSGRSRRVDVNSAVSELAGGRADKRLLVAMGR